MKLVLAYNRDKKSFEINGFNEAKQTYSAIANDTEMLSNKMIEMDPKLLASVKQISELSKNVAHFADDSELKLNRIRGFAGKFPEKARAEWEEYYNRYTTNVKKEIYSKEYEDIQTILDERVEEFKANLKFAGII